MKRQTKGIVVLVLSGVCALGAPGVGWAQEAGVEELADTEAAEAAAETEGVEPAQAEEAGVREPAAEAEEGMISIDFKDADIRQVLRIISLKGAVDIVAGSDVEALVTIKLTNVPWEQALSIILRTYGFTYERKGRIIRVMTVEALEQEALATEVFALDYADAKEVPDIITEMLSDRGKVKFDERTNTVIVTDIPTNLFQIKQVIERLDQRTPQVVIETKIVETRLERDENLGIDWESTLRTTATLSAATIPVTFPFPAGSRLGKLGEHFVPRAGEFSPETGASLPEGLVPERGGTFTFGTLTHTNLSAILNLLQKRTDTHIVSNPTVAVLNNQEARIHIGQEYPIPSFSIDPTTGRTTVTGFEPRDTGTVLTVTPHVNPSKEIVVDLQPEVVAVGTPVSFASGDGTIQLPLFTTQTATTQVRIKNGETIAIGGLVKTSEAKVETKVPILGDIPILGLLFKNTRWYSGGSEPNRQDLLIFLTVALVEEDEPVERQGPSRGDPAAFFYQGLNR